MRALLIGATGTIGSAIENKLKSQGAEVISVGHSSGKIRVDITSTESIREMYEKAGSIDSVIVTTGGGVPFESIMDMKKEDYIKGSQGKLYGQMDVVLTGLKYLNEGGSFTLTTGILNKEFIPKGSCIAMINSAVEGFVQCGAFELPKGFRLNVVSPKLIEESKEKYQKLMKGFDAIPAEKVALAYVKSVYSNLSGKIFRF